MAVPLTAAFKLGFALALVLAILASACARAPRRSVDPAELRRLVVCALGLYGVGGFASLTHHSDLAGLVYGAGIGVSALAAWLSRGRDQEDPPGDEDPVHQPPPEPDGLREFDWARFEREFRAYTLEQRSPSQPSRVG